MPLSGLLRQVNLHHLTGKILFSTVVISWLLAGFFFLHRQHPSNDIGFLIEPVVSAEASIPMVLATIPFGTIDEEKSAMLLDEKKDVSNSKKGICAPSLKVKGVIHLNTATISDLDQLEGIGVKTAEKILEYRREHGAFKTIEELMEVKGIGQKKFDKMKPRLTL